MFAVKRIFRNSKRLTNYICTSSVKCDKSKEPNLFKEIGKEENEAKIKVKQNSKINDILSDLRPRQKKKKVLGERNIFKKALVSSAESVAEEFGGDKIKTKKDLLEQIKQFEVIREEASFDGYEKDDQIYGKMDFKAKSRTNEKPSSDAEFKQRPKRKYSRIFKDSIRDVEDQVKLEIWDDLKAEQLAYLSKTAPRNYFEELIEWTNEGRLWKFPIDNDQGRDVEAATSFTEHIFMEKHLEPWCPKKGPLRKFMELVLIGLSKNPYLSVKEKKEHILWYKDYFEEKKKLLQDLGAMAPSKIEGSDQESCGNDNQI